MPHRGKWPARLFHHSPVENAADILTAGTLRSRNDPLNPRRADIAAPGVIDACDIAHDYARLYFRPRTPTQYNIEGIRRANECAYGPRAHAPILVMLVFDARRALTQPGVRVSNGNMQVGGVIHDETEAFFAALPFEKIFHEGAYPADQGDIKFHRCAGRGPPRLPQPAEDQRRGLLTTLTSSFVPKNAPFAGSA